MASRINRTSIDVPAARALAEAANGRWARRVELAELAGVKKTSADFYVRALFLAGRLIRRRIDYDNAMSPYAYEYRLRGT